MKQVFLLLTIGLLTAFADINYPVKSVKPYPAKLAPYWNAPVYRCEDSNVSGTLYGFLNFKKQVSVLQVKLTYRATKDTSVSFGLNYKNEKGGKDGSSPVIKLKSSEDFTTQTMDFDVPPTARQAQFLITVKGNPAEIELKKIEWTTGSDSAKLQEMTVSDKPSSWEGCAELQKFYLSTSGTPATVQTRVRLAYDQTNLYIGFIADEPNMANLKETVTERDGAVWNDDTVELFLFDRNRNSGWQFCVNPKNTQYDGVLSQAQEGDPYKVAPWDGEWTSQIWKGKASWEALFVIPWSTLNYPSVPEELYMNFGRERPGNKEVSQWNAFIGGFHTAPKYARAVFGPNGEIIRYRKIEAASYIPERARTSGQELLSQEPGNYIVGMWAHGFYKKDYPSDTKESFTVEKQKAFFEKVAENNMFGPTLPWAAKEANVPDGIEELKRLNKQFGMKFPYALFGSGVHAIAINEHNAPLFRGKFADPAQEAYIQAALDVIATLKKFISTPGNRELVNFVHGIDEPTNPLASIYNVKKNPELKAALAEYDEKVKAETGFGKYGYYDWSETPDEGTPFRKIAFYSYWNKHFANYLKQTTDAIRDVDPKLPYLAVNVNTCSGLPVVDFAVLSPHAEYFGCDPYPTSTKNFFGMSRAVYHTGFTVRMVHDLANKSRTCVMPQGFIYHGGRPSPADIREWTSQALKNGAEFFYWYTLGPACVEIPDTFEEMLKINKQLSSMNKLPLPTETKSAILYSVADRAALDDKASHAVYTVYSIIGEHVKANFRFVSPSGLKTKLHSLDGIKILYIPRMRYTDPETTGIILDFVKNGGTLVVFDPEFWKFNTDGSSVAERELVFGELATRDGVPSPLKYGKKELPVTAAANINLNSGKITAYDFVENTGKAVVLYPDDKPAAVEKAHGKGKIIAFGVMPFGNSDAAINPEGWKKFFTDLCANHGEETGLPIWDFVLSE